MPLSTVFTAKVGSLEMAEKQAFIYITVLPARFAWRFEKWRGSNEAPITEVDKEERKERKKTISAFDEQPSWDITQLVIN